MIITVARQFWISTQSGNHHIILASDVRDFRHLKLTKDIKSSLEDNRKIWLTKNPSKVDVVCEYRERNTQELIPKMQTTVTKAKALGHKCYRVPQQELISENRNRLHVPHHPYLSAVVPYRCCLYLHHNKDQWRQRGHQNKLAPGC